MKTVFNTVRVTVPCQHTYSDGNKCQGSVSMLIELAPITNEAWDVKEWGGCQYAHGMHSVEEAEATANKAFHSANLIAKDTETLICL